QRALDDATSETDLALIEHHRLPRSHCPLRLVKVDPPAVRGSLEGTVLVRLTIAYLGGETQRPAVRQRIDPVDVGALQRCGEQPRVVVALADNQHIALEVLAQHIPGVITGTLQPTDAQPLALADGVVHESVVTTDDITFGGFNVAGLSRQVALEEVGEAPLADETDTGRVLLACRGQFILLGNAPDFGFFQLANRKQGPCQLFPGNGMQEIALILVAVQATQQQRLSVAVSPARIMT